MHTSEQFTEHWIGFCVTRRQLVVSPRIGLETVVESVLGKTQRSTASAPLALTEPAVPMSRDSLGHGETFP